MLRSVRWRAPGAMVETASISAPTPAWNAVYGKRDTLQAASPSVRQGAPSANTGNVSIGGARGARSATRRHGPMVAANRSKTSAPASSAIRKPERRRTAAAPAKSASRASASPIVRTDVSCATMASAASVTVRVRGVTNRANAGAVIQNASDATSSRANARRPVPVGWRAAQANASTVAGGVAKAAATAERFRCVRTRPRSQPAAVVHVMISTRMIETAAVAEMRAGSFNSPKPVSGVRRVAASAEAFLNPVPCPRGVEGWSAARRTTNAVMATA